MPESLKVQFKQHDLLIFKGDANYRRLLDDIIFPEDTKFADETSYFEQNVVAIRTCKSPIVCGISRAKVEQLNKEDNQWKVNGKYGLIQNNFSD